MNREEFIELIESIGFKYKYGYFYYKEFRIDLYNMYYNFFNGSGWYLYNYNDLKPLENYFKKDMRSIKLKHLLR